MHSAPRPFARKSTNHRSRNAFNYRTVPDTDLPNGRQGDAGFVRLLLGGLPAQGLEPSVQKVVAWVDPGAGPHLPQFIALHLGTRTIQARG